MSRPILLIDNFDSFVHNLARYFRRLGQKTLVVRNDAITPEKAAQMRPGAMVLSPGPCTPSEAGCSLEIVRRLAGQVPVLGVCLGHQTIGAAFGGRVIRAPSPMHGRSSLIEHNCAGLFEGLPSPLRVGRYHSLIVEERTLPAELEVTGRSEDGLIMALAHRRWPIFGVQFHPESVLTDGGYTILMNFLRFAGLKPPPRSPSLADECPAPATESAELPTQPVTF